MNGSSSLIVDKNSANLDLQLSDSLAGSNKVVNQLPNSLDSIAEQYDEEEFTFQQNMPHPSDPGYQKLIDEGKEYAKQQALERELKKKREHGKL